MRSALSAHFHEYMRKEQPYQSIHDDIWPNSMTGYRCEFNSQLKAAFKKPKMPITTELKY